MIYRDVLEDPNASLRALQANDPDYAKLRIDGDLTDELAQRLSQALDGNTVVTSILLYFCSSLSLDGVRGLAHFIACSPSLRELEINCDNPSTDSEFSTTFAIFDELMRAAGCSDTIEDLKILFPCRALALINCLRGLRQSLKYFEFFGDLVVSSDMTPVLNMNLTDMVAKAVSGLTVLESLDIYYLFCSGPGTAFAAMVYDRLAGHPHLKYLRARTDDTADESLGTLLRSSAPLEDLELSLSWPDHDYHGHTVLPAPHGHETLRNLDLEIRLENDEAAADFTNNIVNIVQNNRALESLRVSFCDLEISPLAILGAVAGDNANRSLRKLVLKNGHSYFPRVGDPVTQAEREEACWEGLINIFEQGLSPELKELELIGFPEPAAELRAAAARALLKSTSLHSICIPRHLPLALSEYIGKRNKYRPLLPPENTSKTSGAKWWLPDFFERLRGERRRNDAVPELSVMYDTLRGRSDWYDEPGGARATKRSCSSR